MTQDSLSALYACHSGKVSDKWTLYLREYDRLLSPYRNRAIRLLEVGLQNGGSLDIWGRYFSSATHIVGCDIDPLCASLRYDDPRIQVIVGDANSPAIHRQIVSETPYDVIIDDGSHTSKDIIQSFCTYFPELAEDGIFVVEDLHCSYWASHEGGLSHPFSSMSFFKALADVINMEHWAIEKMDAHTFLEEIFQHHHCTIPLEALAQIHSIEFINSMCVIRKLPAVQNVLGTRIVVGESEIITSGHFRLHGSANSAEHQPRQSREHWAARTEKSVQQGSAALQAANEQVARQVETLDAQARRIEDLDHHWQEAEKALEAARKAIEVATEDARSATATAQAMIHSQSWRLTAPLRRIYSWLKR